MATQQSAVPLRHRLAGLSSPSEGALAVGAGLLLLAGAVQFLPPYPQLARFSQDALTRLPDVLAPLVVIALFLERATEVIMTAWRTEQTRSLDVALASEIARQAAGDARANPWAVKARLLAYRAQSQRLAFLTAVLLALVVSMMGLRAIEMLVEPGTVARFPGGQRALFVWVDILITALLLAGGAEGIHRVVEAFTAFLDSTTQRVNPGGGIPIPPAQVQSAPGATGTAEEPETGRGPAPRD